MNSRLVFAALGILILVSLIYAEAPMHEPSLDYKCGQGFQWSRDVIGCVQANCPAGAGRMDSDACNCGEAWSQPFRTCYSPTEPGLVTSCVAAGALCPGETPPASQSNQSVPQTAPSDGTPSVYPNDTIPSVTVVNPNTVFGPLLTPTQIGNLPCNDSRRIKHDADLITADYLSKVQVNPHTYLLAPFGGLRGIANNLVKTATFGWAGSAYVCGAYQGKVLDLLETKLKAQDKLLECLDFGPIQAKGGIHQAVVVYPKGTNWLENGTVFDPWYTQSHAVYTITNWNIIALGSAAPSAYYSKFPLYGNDYQTDPNTYSPEDVAVLKYLNDPRTQNDPSVIAMSAEYHTLSTDPVGRHNWLINHRNIVIGHSPGNYLMTDRYGRSSGIEPDGTEVENIPGVQFMQYAEDDGTTGMYFEVPSFANLTLSFSANNPGTATVLLDQADSPQMYQYSVFVQNGERLQLALPLANETPKNLTYGSVQIAPTIVPLSAITEQTNTDTGNNICCLPSGAAMLLIGITLVKRN